MSTVTSSPSVRVSRVDWTGLVTAFFLTLIPLLISLMAAPGSSISSRYLSFNNWDSQHYLSIAREGYHLPSPGMKVEEVTSDDVHQFKTNLAFFPGLPMASRLVGQVTGTRAETSLILTSQIFAVLFWLYFFLLMHRARRTPQEAALLALPVLAYPTCFYLVMGYTESLFMAGLLGFIYWCSLALDPREDSQPLRRSLFWILAGAHGVAFTSSRIVGLPLVIFPCVQFLGTWISQRNARGSNSIRSRDVRTAFETGLAAVLASLGVVAFFAWCQSEYGVWDIYLKLQAKGWGNHPDYLAIFKPWKYVPYLFFEDTMDSISRASVPFTLGLMGWILYRDCKKNGKSALSRAGIYYVAFMLFYISMSGKANAKMDSMSRYTLPVVAVLMIANTESRIGERAWTWSRFKIAAVAVSALLQVYMVYMFLRGHWVA